MNNSSQVKRIVVKVGTSTLTYETGKVNLRRMEKIARVLSDLANSGIEIALVSSGAIGIGAGKLGLKERPSDTPGRQAAATVGQCELMFMYDKLFGDNDNLSAHVAKITDADLLIILSDIDGLFTSNPREDENAKFIPVVEEINDEILEFAGSTGSARGTGGMITKLHAAQIASEAGIDTVVRNGKNPEDIYRLLDGRQAGTLIKAKKVQK